MDFKLLIHELFTRTSVSYFVIPIGVMLITWAVQRTFKLRLSAGTELFAFGFALDLDLLSDQAHTTTRVNPQLQASFGAVFTVSLMVSILFLIYASKIQSEILKGSAGKHYYPYVQVGICWIFAIAVIGFHLFAVLGA